MSFNYEKMKDKPALSSGEFWTSYADLATVLSVLFLMMYAIATLRTTTISVANQATREVARQEIDDLKEQIRAFDVLKDEYLQAGASNSEKKMYDDLMGQMKLLQKQAEEEKVELYKQAQEAESKVKGLNRYQSMIKNIISANMIAQSEIKGRDTIIAKKSKNITELRRSVRQRERQIAQNNQEIEVQQQKLEQSIAELKMAYRSKARTRKQMEEAIVKLREDSQKRVENLRQENAQVSQQLMSAKGMIDAQSQEIQQKESALSQKESQVAKLEQERQDILKNLELEQKRFTQSMADLKAAHQQRANAEREMYEQTLRKQKLTAQARIEKEREYRERVEAQKQAYDQKMAQLAQQLDGTRAEISSKERELNQKKGQVAQLEQERREILQSLEQQQLQSQQSIAELRAKHREKVEAERQAFERSLKREKLTAQARLQKEAEYRERIEQEKQAYNQRMKALSQQLEGTKAEISQKEQELQSTKSASAQKEQQFRKALANSEAEKQKIMGELEAQQRGYQKSMARAQQAYKAKFDSERKKFEAGLAREKLSGEARVAREKAYREMVEQQKAAYDAQMRSLSQQLDGTKQAIANREAQFQSEMSKVSSAKEGLERQLASVRAREEQKKRLVAKIADGFRRAGINATFNPNTGEVTLNFGQEYFDTGSAVLTPGMKKVLEQAFPIYARSVLEDPELAKKVQSVEIAGFASPTFQGKYVNPKELSPEARQAVNYNMDLSYQRAKSIFAYVFDPKRVAYKHQRDLLSISKVSGLGYLRAQGADGSADEESLSQAQYCEKYDCSKSQKVVIKFNFTER